MYHIDGVEQALKDAVERGVLNGAEVVATVERWRTSERELDEATEATQDRDTKIGTALREFNESTNEVTQMYVRSL